MQMKWELLYLIHFWIECIHWNILLMMMRKYLLNQSFSFVYKEGNYSLKVLIDYSKRNTLSWRISCIIILLHSLTIQIFQLVLETWIVIFQQNLCLYYISNGTMTSISQSRQPTTHSIFEIEFGVSVVFSFTLESFNGHQFQCVITEDYDVIITKSQQKINIKLEQWLVL